MRTIGNLCSICWVMSYCRPTVSRVKQQAWYLRACVADNVRRSTGLNTCLGAITSAHRGRCNIANQTSRLYSTGLDDSSPYGNTSYNYSFEPPPSCIVNYAVIMCIIRCVFILYDVPIGLHLRYNPSLTSAGFVLGLHLKPAWHTQQLWIIISIIGGVCVSKRYRPTEKKQQQQRNMQQNTITVCFLIILEHIRPINTWLWWLIGM